MTRIACFLLAAFLCAGPALAEEPSGALLLVARPELPDPFFADSVVVVSNAGAAPLGVILNKPLEATLAKAFPKEERLRKRQEKLFFGGPIEPREVVFIFRASEASDDAVRLMPGVYASMSHEILEKLLARDAPLEGLRIFAGHAGWAPGQLEAEIARGDWQLAPVDAATLFTGKPQSLWNELHERLGGTRVRAILVPACASNKC